MRKADKLFLLAFFFLICNYLIYLVHNLNILIQDTSCVDLYAVPGFCHIGKLCLFLCMQLSPPALKFEICCFSKLLSFLQIDTIIKHLKFEILQKALNIFKNKFTTSTFLKFDKCLTTTTPTATESYNISMYNNSNHYEGNETQKC